MRRFIIAGRPSRATGSTRSQNTSGNRLKARFSHLSNRAFRWGHKKKLKSSSATAQGIPAQNVVGADPGFMLDFDNDPKWDNESSELLYDNASCETRVSFESLSSWKPLLE
jgi:hypothetical protein